MEPVYHEFLRRDRETGIFLHPAKRQGDGQADEETQVVALGEILKVTISAASDRISVSKIAQIAEAKQRWGGNAKLLRDLAHDMELAAELGMLGINDPLSRWLAVRDLDAVRRVANLLDHLGSALRQQGDPLIVERHRGDPIVRGVQILVGSQIEEQFGKRLDGTAAALTGVALDVKTSPRASRSALTSKQSRKRRDSR